MSSAAGVSCRAISSLSPVRCSCKRAQWADRAACIGASQQAQGGEGDETFTKLLYERLSDTLDDYLRVLQEGLSPGSAR